jgi:hypothetical protein
VTKSDGVDNIGGLGAWRGTAISIFEFVGKYGVYSIVLAVLGAGSWVFLERRNSDEQIKKLKEELTINQSEYDARIVTLNERITNLQQTIDRMRQLHDTEIGIYKLRLEVTLTSKSRPRLPPQ